MKIVIAGGGPAALESAAAARKVSDKAEIDIFSAENILPYRRPALSGLLGIGKTVDEKTFFIKPASFFSDFGIGFHPDRRAVSVKGSTLFFESGESVGFDRLIIASGSEAVRPPISGIDGKNVFSLRSYADMIKINEKLDAGVKNAVVIGGGVLGLEIAESLLSRNIHVTVLEASPCLFQGKLDAADADALYSRLNNISALKILCGKSVLSVSETEVSVADHPPLSADIVIVACGSRADLSLARSASLDCGRGIKVNDRMQSSREDIFAAGDCAEFNGRCFNLYMDAVMGGRTAGSNAAGVQSVFNAVFSPLRFFSFGEKLVMK